MCLSLVTLKEVYRLLLRPPFLLLPLPLLRFILRRLRIRSLRDIRLLRAVLVLLATMPLRDLRFIRIDALFALLEVPLALFLEFLRLDMPPLFLLD